MRSLLISAALGLASLGVLGATANEADAQTWRWRHWAPRTYYWTGPYYWSPGYYAPPAYTYPAVPYYAPYFSTPYYSSYYSPSVYTPSYSSEVTPSYAAGPMRSAPITTPPTEVIPAAAATPAASTPVAGLVTINIQDDSYSQSEIAVPPGTTVRWNNEGRRMHTVTSDKGLFNSQDLTPGEAFSFTFNRAGTYSYHCKHHPKTMRGTVTVR